MIYVRVYDGVVMVVGGDIDSFCRVFLVLVTVFGGDERTLVPDKARASGHRLDGGTGRQSDVAESVKGNEAFMAWWIRYGGPWPGNERMMTIWLRPGREDDYHLAPARVTFLPR